MLFPLLLQEPGIEPRKPALKLDTLTTDLLGTIYNSVEISRSDEAFEESLNSSLWTKPFSCGCQTIREMIMVYSLH